MNVLFVCTGNLCRSPMAEALFSLIARSRKRPEVKISSAGTWAAKGSRATPDALDVLETVGVDASDHRSRPLRRKHIEEADLIVAMTSVHLLEIQDKVADSGSKLVLLKEVAEIEMPDLPLDLSPDERLEHFLRAKRPGWRRQLDLDDPMGLPRVAYIRCIKEVWDGVEALANVLIPRIQEPPGEGSQYEDEAEASSA
jgi:protein-tyrosine-phosphatase